jgi:DNA-binding MarR family transcriptional regulator
MNDIAVIRKFSRTFTRAIGLLESSYHGRGRSLAASRLLFEIGPDGCQVRALRERLGFDSGYLSRLLRMLEHEALVSVVKDQDDRRIRVVSPTKKGLDELRILNEMSDSAASAMLNRVPKGKRDEFTSAFELLERLIRANEITIGPIDVMSHKSQNALAAYYAELAERFGFNTADDKGEQFTPPSGLFLLARHGSTVVGCAGLILYPEYAEIKRMWVHREYRGIGIASRLLDELEKTALLAKKHTVRLDTNDTLKQAQNLYALKGYREIEQYNENPFADHWYEKKLGST